MGRVNHLENNYSHPILNSQLHLPQSTIRQPSSNQPSPKEKQLNKGIVSTLSDWNIMDIITVVSIDLNL